ncbi:hypothetical protein F8B42_00219 [Klebsiella aerogenes]|nr:hypothetical protein F8B42_00219 [Klebsiella aerogenes]
MSKLTEQEKALFAGVTGRGGGAALYFSPCWQIPERDNRFS